MKGSVEMYRKLVPKILSGSHKSRLTKKLTTIMDHPPWWPFLARHLLPLPCSLVQAFPTSMKGCWKKIRWVWLCRTLYFSFWSLTSYFCCSQMMTILLATCESFSSIRSPPRLSSVLPLPWMFDLCFSRCIALYWYVHIPFPSDPNLPPTTHLSWSLFSLLILLLALVVALIVALSVSLLGLLWMLLPLPCSPLTLMLGSSSSCSFLSRLLLLLLFAPSLLLLSWWCLLDSFSSCSVAPTC